MTKRPGAVKRVIQRLEQGREQESQLAHQVEHTRGQGRTDNRTEGDGRNTLRSHKVRTFKTRKGQLLVILLIC